MNLKRIFVGLAAGVVTIIVLIVGGFLAWANNSPAPEPAAQQALTSTPTVTVTTDNGLAFTPVQPIAPTGFIFYPGGRVRAEAYAPAAMALAEAGYLTVLVPMPANLAVFDRNAADRVMAAYPQIENWVIGGHSLGGSMAGSYAATAPEKLAGLVLWASVPAENISTSTLEIASIYGTADGLLAVESVLASQAFLPETAELVAIEGGNHAQFGYYGDQAGDNPATISRAEQQAAALQATLAVLENVSQRP